MGTENPEHLYREKWINGRPGNDRSVWIPARNILALEVRRAPTSPIADYYVAALVGSAWLQLTSGTNTFGESETKLLAIVQQLQESPNPYNALGLLESYQEGEPDESGSEEGQEGLQADHGA